MKTIMTLIKKFVLLANINIYYYNSKLKYVTNLFYTLTEGGLSPSPPPPPQSVRRLWDGIRNSTNRQTLDKNKMFKFNS